MLAASALLWFFYFVPSWIRRREYLATERTATRLQQTMRVLAEAAEVPDTVRVEASIHEAAKQERIRLALERQAARAALREAEAAARAQREIEQARTQTDKIRARTVSAPRDGMISLTQRLRRTRRAAGLVLLAAVVLAGVQLGVSAPSGFAPGAVVLLAGCAVAGMASFLVQARVRVRLASVRRVVPSAPRVARPVDVPLDVAPEQRAWTPVPLPKPIYVEHPHAARVRPTLGAPTMDSGALLRAAAAEAEHALREAAAEPEVVQLASRPTASKSTPPSRYAKMGIVDDTPVSAPDLDEVLRRRRNVG